MQIGQIGTNPEPKPVPRIAELEQSKQKYSRLIEKAQQQGDSTREYELAEIKQLKKQAKNACFKLFKQKTYPLDEKTNFRAIYDDENMLTIELYEINDDSSPIEKLYL
jgi:hypothetical protein